ncbi:MAG: C39 family peptidase [Lentisphaeria bacterium]|nr:C39 family peptidase [Lentisphaeria bacterium]NQZ66982.1 C39 family peptidase [Lentisphaeria bacterium]
MKIKLFFIILALNFFSYAETLDKLSLSEDLFDTSNEDFISIYAPTLAFRYSSKDKESARSNLGALRFLKMKTDEVIVKFKNEKISEVKIMLYNKGDAGTMVGRGFSFNKISKAKFEDMIENATKKINVFLNIKKPKKLSRSTAQKTAAKRYTHYWVKGKTLFLLEWSGDKIKPQGGGRKVYMAEYLRVRLKPYTGKSSITKLDKIAKIRKKDTKANLVHDENGDIYIKHIPMVDQGPKGYCVAAAVSRVLQYYGRNTDMHEVAKVAKTTAGGTGPEEIYNALKKIRTRMGLSLEAPIKFDNKDFLKMIKDYNRMAKRKKERQVSAYGFSVFEQMDLDILMEAKLKRKTRYDKFKNNIYKHIKTGTPLAWTLIIMFPEQNFPQASFSGHMRLITGYNKKTDMVIYSDTWGAGHEKKEMSMKKAFTSTTGLYILKLKN